MLVILRKIDKFKAVCKCQQCSKEYVVSNFYGAKISKCGDICKACKNILVNMIKPTQQVLRKVFEYNKLTGIITYKVKTIRKQIGDTAGHKHISGYLEIRFDKKNRMLLHRMIFLHQTGYLPEQVDHINHNKLDNRWINLRAADNTTNAKNCSISKNSVTKITGVNYMPSINKYRAYIMINRKHIHLGVFIDITKAIEARQKANIKYNFHKNHGK